MSVRIEILRFLAKGKSLTALEALNRFNCLSLSQRVGELVKEGWPIKFERINDGVSKLLDAGVHTVDDHRGLARTLHCSELSKSPNNPHGR